MVELCTLKKKEGREKTKQNKTITYDCYSLDCTLPQRRWYTQMHLPILAVWFACPLAASQHYQKEKENNEKGARKYKANTVIEIVQNIFFVEKVRKSTNVYTHIKTTNTCIHMHKRSQCSNECGDLIIGPAYTSPHMCRSFVSGTHTLKHFQTHTHHTKCADIFIPGQRGPITH